jgi:hypothetical protein
MHPQRVAQLEQDEGSAPVRDEGASRSASPARITARERSRVQVAVHRADGGILGEYDARQRELAEEEQLQPVTVTVHQELPPINEEDEVEALIENTAVPTVPHPPAEVDDRNA